MSHRCHSEIRALHGCMMASRDMNVVEPADVRLELDGSGTSGLCELYSAPSALGVSEKCRIDTPYGEVQVTIQGDQEKPAIITYHDVGLNHSTTFRSFLSDQTMSPLAAKFCWYHIDAPGQEDGASRLPDDYCYPTMTELAEQIEYIADHFQFSDFLGLGIGSGANIMARYAAISPERVRGLVLINLMPNSVPWLNLSRLVGKVVSWQLRGRSEGLTRLATYHLTRQTFGPTSPDIDDDLVQVFGELVDCQHPHNLALFLDSYHKRSSVAGDFAKLVRCNTLFVVSSNFDSKEEVAKLCSLLDSQKATLLEIPNTSGLLLDDQPAKIAMALRLFLQGMGLIPSLSSHSTLHHHHRLSLQGLPSKLHSLVDD